MKFTTNAQLTCTNISILRMVSLFNVSSRLALEEIVKNVSF